MKDLEDVTEILGEINEEPSGWKLEAVYSSLQQIPRPLDFTPSSLQLFNSAVKRLCNQDCESETSLTTDLLRHGLCDVLSMLFQGATRKVNSQDDIDQILSIMDLICVLCDASVDAKSMLADKFSAKFLQQILRSKDHHNTMEMVKCINLLVESCSVSCREKLLQDDNILNALQMVATMIHTAGDYEVQVGIIECLFRFTPRRHREKFAHKFFADKTMAKHFTDIRDSFFETDCRLFLNRCNSQLLKDPKVFSFPCLSACLGTQELKKPSDTNYAEFWVDFNAGLSRISLFCENDFSESQGEESTWETVSIWKKDVRSYNLDDKKNPLVLSLSLKSGLEDCVPNVCVGQTESYITLSFGLSLSVALSEALLSCYGKELKWTKKSKSSEAVTPIALNIRPQSNCEQKSKSSEAVTPIALNIRPQSNCEQNHVENSRTHKKNQKVSIPTQPMVIPANFTPDKDEVPYSLNTPCVPVVLSKQRTNPRHHSSEKCGSKTPKSPRTPCIDESCNHERNPNKVLSKDDPILKTPTGKNTRSKGKVKTPLLLQTTGTRGNCKKKKWDEVSSGLEPNHQLCRFKSSDVCELDSGTKENHKQKKSDEVFSGLEPNDKLCHARSTDVGTHDSAGRRKSSKRKTSIEASPSLEPDVKLCCDKVSDVHTDNRGKDAKFDSAGKRKSSKKKTSIEASPSLEPDDKLCCEKVSDVHTDNHSKDSKFDSATGTRKSGKRKTSIEALPSLEPDDKLCCGKVLDVHTCDSAGTRKGSKRKTSIEASPSLEPGDKLCCDKVLEVHTRENASDTYQDVIIPDSLPMEMQHCSVEVLEQKTQEKTENLRSANDSGISVYDLSNLEEKLLMEEDAPEKEVTKLDKGTVERSGKHQKGNVEKKSGYTSGKPSTECPVTFPKRTARSKSGTFKVSQVSHQNQYEECELRQLSVNGLEEFSVEAFYHYKKGIANCSSKPSLNRPKRYKKPVYSSSVSQFPSSKSMKDPYDFDTESESNAGSVSKMKTKETRKAKSSKRLQSRIKCETSGVQARLSIIKTEKISSKVEGDSQMAQEFQYCCDPENDCCKLDVNPVGMCSLQEPDQGNPENLRTSHTASRRPVGLKKKRTSENEEDDPNLRDKTEVSKDIISDFQSACKDIVCGSKMHGMKTRSCGRNAVDNEASNSDMDVEGNEDNDGKMIPDSFSRVENRLSAQSEESWSGSQAIPCHHGFNFKALAHSNENEKRTVGTICHSEDIDSITCNIKKKNLVVCLTPLTKRDLTEASCSDEVSIEDTAYSCEESSEVSKEDRAYLFEETTEVSKEDTVYSCEGTSDVYCLPDLSSNVCAVKTSPCPSVNSDINHSCPVGVSGPSFHTRLSRSALKRKYGTVSDSDSGDSCEESESQPRSFLPRRLFKKGLSFNWIQPPSQFQTLKLRPAGSRDDILKLGEEAGAERIKWNENHDDSLQSLNTGINTFIKAFGEDLQKQMKNKWKRLDELMTNASKSTQKRWQQIWKQQSENRSQQMDSFKVHMVQELEELEKDVARLKHAEEQTNDFLKKQIAVIQSCRKSQELRMKNLRCLCLSYDDLIEKTDSEEKCLQVSLTDSLKTELDVAKRKIIRDTQKQEVEKFKRGVKSLI